jgi:hypothetical protein
MYFFTPKRAARRPQNQSDPPFNTVLRTKLRKNPRLVGFGQVKKNKGLFATMTIQQFSSLVKVCRSLYDTGGSLMRQATSTPIVQPGDRVIALLPLRFREEPATVAGRRRDGSILVVLDALPAKSFVCCDWRRQPEPIVEGGARP